MNLFFPYQVDGRGRSRRARRDEDNDEYIRGLIQQLLLTSPGERVMRPEFGSGLRQLLFAGNSPELATSTQMMMQGALQQWLGDLILVESVQIQAIESALQVEVVYIVRRSQEQHSVTFTQAVQS
ncbi:MAG TPA: GPW/gp25 family protein [Xanthomonadales bacterium]|nr:GPW/gp25 family protein [Xanthomonadales bacterium]